MKLGKITLAVPYSEASPLLYHPQIHAVYELDKRKMDRV